MQQNLIAHWLDEPSHQELFYQWLTEWEELHPQALGDPEKAWVSLNGQIEQKSIPTADSPAASERQASPIRFPFRRWVVAASLLLAGGLTFLLRDTLFWDTYRTGNGEINSFRLSDGSLVTLNANSELRVPILFIPQRDRTVRLTGEADFSVSHRTNDQSFVVETSSEVDIVVLGTEFVARSRNGKFRVALHSGKITLEQNGKPNAEPFLTLKPGDVATLNEGNHIQLVSQQHTRQLAAWRDHLFVFDRQSLPEVLTMLEEHFGESVKLANDSLSTHLITGRFRAERAEDLLEILSELTGYRIVTRDGQKYLVPGQIIN